VFVLPHDCTAAGGARKAYDTQSSSSSAVDRCGGAQPCSQRAARIPAARQAGRRSRRARTRRAISDPARDRSINPARAAAAAAAAPPPHAIDQASL
jgi:hypothetical protein